VGCACDITCLVLLIAGRLCPGVMRWVDRPRVSSGCDVTSLGPCPGASGADRGASFGLVLVSTRYHPLVPVASAGACISPNAFTPRSASLLVIHHALGEDILVAMG
jgi:hypothetical protein